MSETLFSAVIYLSLIASFLAFVATGYLVHRSVGLVRPKRVTPNLKREKPADQPILRTAEDTEDPLRITQSLIKNAIRFFEPGGSIAIFQEPSLRPRPAFRRLLFGHERDTEREIEHIHALQSILLEVEKSKVKSSFLTSQAPSPRPEIGRSGWSHLQTLYFVAFGGGAGEVRFDIIEPDSFTMDSDQFPEIQELVIEGVQ